MTTPAIMILGTGSNAGKSLLVAGLARAFTRRGLRVRPFKPQNMSNNAAVTDDGGEIGRAQALQARACKMAPSIHMNPVLLKPETETGAQVIVQGKRLMSCAARDYARLKPELLSAVLESFDHMASGADLILVEGAGSPAEVNLRQGDIANLGFAVQAGIPAILAGDIDRGGVIASLVGTHTLLENEERSMIRGFLINKFRGDASLFDTANTEIATRTGWAGLGVVPWFENARRLPAEDSLDLETRTGKSEGSLHVAALKLARIANFDDLDPLSLEPGVRLEIINPGEAVPGICNLIIIPGSKSTLDDLAFLKANGWDTDIRAHLRRGGHVLGLCGGYQMLGNCIKDPDGLEGIQTTASGLGLLDVETHLEPEKTTSLVNAIHVDSGLRVQGYEIHLGTTQGKDRNRPFLMRNDEPEGACSEDGRVCGTYLHGLFSDDAFRRAYLERIGLKKSGRFHYENLVEQTLDELSEHLEQYLDLDEILKIAQTRSHSAAANKNTNRN